jgi:hypothetical protein
MFKENHMRKTPKIIKILKNQNNNNYNYNKQI